MTARISAKEAKALGLTAPDAKPAKKRTTRKTASGPYHTRCTCGEEFTTAASEDRHVAESHHARYELILPERNPE